jgi:hypothetical protein
VAGAARLLAAALAVLGLAACTAPDRPGPAAVAVTSTTAPDGLRGRTVAWEAGRLDPDPRRVVVSWTGADPEADPSDPCWVGYAPEVRAAPDRVVVAIRSYRSRSPLGPRQYCPDIGFVRTLAVPLPGDLAGRPVTDGHGGRRHRLAPVPLEPGWLPDGWRLVRELGEEFTGGPSWERSYGPAGDAGGLAPGAVGVAEVTVRDGPPVVGRPGSAAFGDRVVAHLEVRGVPAAVVRADAGQQLAVHWREGRRGLAVAATFPTAPSDRTVAAVRDLLVRIARGLR